MTCPPFHARLDERHVSSFTFDPATPLAGIRKVEHVDEDKRVGEIAKVVRAMAATGVLNAVTEEIVRDYVTRRELLSRSAFRAIVRESRPSIASPFDSFTPSPYLLGHLRATGATVTAVQHDGPPGRRAPTSSAGSWGTSVTAVGSPARNGTPGSSTLSWPAESSTILRRPRSRACRARARSYTVECVLRAFSASAVIVMTAMSEHALIYMRESFAHRTLVLYEATALREGREKNEGNQTAMFIRTLLSRGPAGLPHGPEGQARQPRHNRDREGRPHQPPGHHHRDQPPQRERDSHAVAHGRRQQEADHRRPGGHRRREKRSNNDFSDWHDFDHWIWHANHDVTVPYAQWLAANIPPVAVRLRRDFATLLALIETHAIIHQLDRETDAQGRIIATPDDYLAVRALVADLMSDAVGTTVKATVRQTVEAIRQLTTPRGVTVKQLADHLQLERSAAQYRVQAARDGGFIVNIEDRRGMPARYTLDNPLPAEVALLPEAIPEDIHTRTLADHPEHASSQTTQGVRV